MDFTRKKMASCGGELGTGFRLSFSFLIVLPLVLPPSSAGFFSTQRSFLQGMLPWLALLELAFYACEEFAILLARKDSASACFTAGRLFRKITDLPVQTPAGPVRIPISVGVPTACENCSTINPLLKCADQALYEAKTASRNRISAWNK